MKFRNSTFISVLAIVIGCLFIIPDTIWGQATTNSTTTVPITLKVDLSQGDKPVDVNIAIKILFLMTLLTLAPSIMMLTTSFTRIVIVLGFVRNAIGVSGAPSNQILIGLALFLTFFIMGPIWNRIHETAVAPYVREEITSKEALDRAAGELKGFMLKQTRTNDIEFFLGLAGQGPTSMSDLPMRIVLPSFVLSELRTAFQMGFLIFIPFIIVDFLVASTLMAMGMMMMPPVIISLPFKLLLFVLVDGWYLVIHSLVDRGCPKRVIFARGF